MSKIVSIGTALPAYCHKQSDILHFMLEAYQPEAEDRRKITLLYERSGIDTRYSVIPDYSAPLRERQFYARTPDLEPFPDLEQRMQLFHEHATALSMEAIKDCLGEEIRPAEITWLITVSCTGMSAPGLDISIMQQLNLSPNVKRSSINFMGCYAALHALKMADSICRASEKENVLIVCTELCTIHFQKSCDMDSIASSMLFADGSAAVLVSCDKKQGLHLKRFYSEIALQGKDDMAWHLSGKGFLMRLSAYIPQLLQAGIEPLLKHALAEAGVERHDVTHWALHPGGRKILDSIQKELRLSGDDIGCSYDILRRYGNMSSPTVLFVLKDMMKQIDGASCRIFTAAFGPGLTMETLILEQ